MVTVDFVADVTTVTSGDEVTFTDQSTGSPISWTWNFPGGTPNTSQDQNPLVTYSVPGTYAVTLTAANASNDDTQTKTDYITVETALPPVVANFTLSEDTIEVGSSITFTSTSVGNPTTLNWTFEEGTPGTSSEQEPEVTFETLGTHDITLSVSNGDTSDDTVQTITVVPKCALSTSSFDCAETLVFDQMTEGMIDERGKQNYYTFTLPRAAVVEVVATNIDPAINLQAAFYHEDRSEIEKGSPVYNISRGGEFKYDVLLDSGTYYLRIDDRSSDGSGNQPYQLTVSLDSSDVNEFNNDIDSAIPITFTDNSSGVISGTIRSVGDVDFFAFTLEEPAVVEFLITNVDPAIRMEIQLYNRDRTTNGREVSALFGENQLSHNRLLDKGTYYLRLNDQNNDQSGKTVYGLTISLDKSDPNELNQTIENPTTITLGTTVKGTIRSVGDQDFYQFTLSKESTVNISITNVDPAIRMEMQLYNRDKTTNGGSVLPPFGQNQLDHDRQLEAGTYFLRLNDQNNDQSGKAVYELTVTAN